MRIAVVGAGVSGLVAAHLLARAHDVTVFEAGATPAATRTPSASTPPDETHGSTPASSSSTTATTRTSSALLDELGVAAPAVGHELRGQRRARRLRVRGTLGERPVRQARAPGARRGSTGWSPTSCASTARRASCCATGRRRTRRCGDWLEERGFSRPFVDRLIVPQAAAVWSADPRQMWTFPARFLAEFFAQPRDARLHATARSGARCRRLARATSRRSPRRGATASAWPRRSRAIARHDDHVAVTPRGGEAERFDEVVLATHSDQALALLADPTRPRARAARRDPLPAQRGRAAHRRAACCRAAAAPGRAGTTTCSTSRPAQPTVTYHMNRLQSLTRRPRVLRDAQPHRARSTRRRSSARSTTRTRSTRARAHAAQARHARDQRRATARTTAAPTGAGASTRTASSARCASPRRLGRRAAA